MTVRQLHILIRAWTGAAGTAALFFCIAMLVGADFHAAAASRDQVVEVEPHMRFRDHLLRYAGPGREAPPPADVDHVTAAWFGPFDPKDPLHGDGWLAACLAVEESNAAGGVGGLPVRLLPVWSDNPWAGGVTALTRLVYTEPVLAILGCPDGPSAHLAAQVVAKARLPLICAASADTSVNLANVPWTFTCKPDDRRLVAAVTDALGAGWAEAAVRFAVIRTTDHDGHYFAREMERALSARQVFPVMRLELAGEGRAGQTGSVSAAPGGGVVDGATGGADGDAGGDVDGGDVADGAVVAAVRQVLAARPDVLLVAAGAADSAVLVRALGAEGFSGTLVGGPAMARRLFLDRAGAAAEGAIVPVAWEGGDAFEAFCQRFEARHGRRPEGEAAFFYDTVRIFVAAAQAAGRNRALIGDAIRDGAPWPGASGPIAWDNLGAATRPARLAVIRAGALAPYDKPDDAINNGQIPLFD